LAVDSTGLNPISVDYNPSKYRNHAVNTARTFQIKMLWAFYFQKSVGIRITPRSWHETDNESSLYT